MEKFDDDLIATEIKYGEFDDKSVELGDFGMAEEAKIEAERDREVAREKAKGSSRRIFTILVVLLAMPVALFGLGIVDTDSFASAGTPEVPTYTAEFLASAIGPNSPESPPGISFNQHIIYREGELFIRGVASSQARVDETVDELAQLFGIENVFAEIVIDPAFPDEVNSGTAVFFDDTILFESGSAIVAPEFSEVLGASVSFLELSPETTIEISGHTDSDGDAESNLELSQQRVDAARQVMIEWGGDSERITAVGLGEAAPIADNSTAEGRALNRRVELQIENNDG